MCLEQECARNQLENMGIRQLIGLDTTKVSDGIGLVSALKLVYSRFDKILASVCRQRTNGTPPSDGDSSRV